MFTGTNFWFSIRLTILSRKFPLHLIRLLLIISECHSSSLIPHARIVLRLFIGTILRDFSVYSVFRQFSPVENPQKKYGNTDNPSEREYSPSKLVPSVAPSSSSPSAQSCCSVPCNTGINNGTGTNSSNGNIKTNTNNNVNATFPQGEYLLIMFSNNYWSKDEGRFSSFFLFREI